jgi:TPR repeat protein
MDIVNVIKEAQTEYLENGDIVKAEKLLLKAAEAGSGHAAHELGVLYIVGGEGLEPNHEKSQYWLEKSLASGFEKTIASDPEWFRKQ